MEGSGSKVSDASGSHGDVSPCVTGTILTASHISCETEAFKTGIIQKEMSRHNKMLILFFGLFSSQTQTKNSENR